MIAGIEGRPAADESIARSLTPRPITIIAPMPAVPSNHGPRKSGGLRAAFLALALVAGLAIGACEQESTGPAITTPAPTVPAALPSDGPRRDSANAPGESREPASAPSGQTPSAGPLPTQPDPDAGQSRFDQFVRENARQAATAAERVRGLDRQFLEPRIVSPDEAAAEIAAALEDQDAEEIRWRDRTLQLLGVLAAGQGLDEIYLALVPDQVIGFYLAKEDELYVVEPAETDGTTPDQALITLAHEYVHALQQSNFDIESLSAAVPILDFDRQLALSALIEGDASVFGFTAVAEQVDLQALQSEEPAPPPDLGRSGEFVLQLLVYPYVAGSEYVLGVLLGSGLSGLNELYDPSLVPQATAQITQLGLRSEWQSSSAAEFAVPDMPCWESLAAGSLGQFVLGVLLGGQIEQGQRGPAGWVDDHLLLIGNGETEVLMYRAEFADTAAAGEFFIRLQGLVGGGRLDHAGRTGSLTETGPAAFSWQLEQRVAFAELDGPGVNLVVGDHASATESAARALAGQTDAGLVEKDYCPAQ